MAYSGLTDSYSSLSNFGFAVPKEVFPRAKEAAQKALEIDDTLAEAHASLGYIKTFYDWDWPGAEKESHRAIELNPSYANAHYYYGMTLVRIGRFDEAIAEEKRALGLDPLSVAITRALGYTFFLARQYDQAIEQERRALELDPDFIWGRVDLGTIYVQKSM